MKIEKMEIEELFNHRQKYLFETGKFKKFYKDLDLIGEGGFG